MRSSDVAVESAPGGRIVFICTGNRARSPFAAAALEARLRGTAFDVESFGTLESAGAPALEPALRAAAERDVDLSAHRARPLTSGCLEGVDLAVGFEPIHVASAVVVGGALRTRAFLLVELVRVLGRVPPGSAGTSLAELVAEADAVRTQTGWSSGMSIADPVGKPYARFRETFAEIERLVDVLAARLHGGGAGHEGVFSSRAP